MSTETIGPLVIQLQRMLLEASQSQNINKDEMTRLLRFVKRVADVVRQAFDNIYSLLIEIKYLRPSDLNSDKIRKLQRELDMLVSRDYFHNVELICGQLRVLSDQYREQIFPIIETKLSAKRNEFQELFYMLDQYEGYLIGIFRNMTNEIALKLESVADEQGLNDLNKLAAETARSMNQWLIELNNMSNSILGISGKAGFLELTETQPEQLPQIIQNTIHVTDNSVHTGDISGNSGSNIALGQNNTQTISNTTNAGLDATAVIALLEELMRDIEKERLDAAQQQKLQSQLEVSKEELKEEKPDKDYIGKNLQKAADTLKKAGVIVTETTAIGKKLLTIAKWVGTVLAFI